MLIELKSGSGERLRRHDGKGVETEIKNSVARWTFCLMTDIPTLEDAD